ncbi:MAG: hypothetical protein Q8P42_04935 [Gallionella sp.]|nr:hypothetical protein [Gallionella sp.]
MMGAANITLLKPDWDSSKPEQSLLHGSAIVSFLRGAAGAGWDGSPDKTRDTRVETTISAATKVPCFMFIPYSRVRHTRTDLNFALQLLIAA